MSEQTTVESGTSERRSGNRVLLKRMRNAGNRFLGYYPFGTSGTILFVVAVYLLGSSVVGKNAYGLVISLVSLFVLILLALLGRWQATRLSRAEVSWDFSPTLYARTPGPNPTAAVDGPAPFLFFRLHTTLRGRLIAGRRSRLSFFRDVATENPSRIEIPLSFPLCGRIEFRTSFHVGDIFGLSQSRFGKSEEFSLPVQAAPFPGSQIPPIQAAGGDRETSRTKQPDEERYYQREYVPGDRFRDINWKASSRLTQLFTRTSPVTQEQTQLLTVYVRHFLPAERLKNRESIESLAHLNVMKSWLLAYLFRMKREHPEFHFRVLTGRGEVILESEEDIHAFGSAISDLTLDAEPAFLLAPESTADGQVQQGKEKDSTIFSTGYDDGLSAFLQTRQRGRMTIYRTVFDSREPRGSGRFFAVKPGPPKPTDTGNAVRFSLLGKDMFATLGSFLPLSVMPTFERSRRNPAVLGDTGIELIERTVIVET